MITATLSLLLFTIFTILSGFHFYWFFGGKWALEKVIPTKKQQIKNITIPKYATLLVALILLFFGVLYLFLSKLTPFQLTNNMVKYMYWCIPILFIIRAIGDFYYVGFFKKIKRTKFAIADTKLFSPLCLIIGILGIITLLN